MDGKQAGDKSVSTPRGYHVTVEERTHGAPEHGTLLQGLDPQEESEDQEEDGNGLVVVTSSHGARDVTRGYAHEHGGEKTSRGRGGHLIGEQVGGNGRQARKRWCEKDANVSNINRNREELEEVVNNTAGDHESGVQGSSGNPTKRMPSTVVEPVPELLKAIGDEILCSPEVEPRINCEGSQHRDSRRYPRWDRVGSSRKTNTHE